MRRLHPNSFTHSNSVANFHSFPASTHDDNRTYRTPSLCLFNSIRSAQCSVVAHRLIQKIVFEAPCVRHCGGKFYYKIVFGITSKTKTFASRAPCARVCAIMSVLCHGWHRFSDIFIPKGERHKGPDSKTHKWERRYIYVDTVCCVLCPSFSTKTNTRCLSATFHLDHLSRLEHVQFAQAQGRMMVARNPLAHKLSTIK